MRKKTEFVAFGRRNTLDNLAVESISVGGELVEVSSAVKYLGVWLDNTLDMKKFISDRCRIASLKLYNIRKIKKYLCRESLTRLVNALVLSHLDYSNALLFGLPESTIRPMQNIQNSAARLILGLSKFEHITPALQQLHWLPIRYRIQFKIMTIVYKAVHNVAPEYICDLIESKQSKYSLRLINGINLRERRSHLKTCGDRAFSVCAPKLWNSLPSEVRTSETVYLFKKRLKTHYFKLAFKTAFTRCRHILKTMKNVTVAKFELAFTRCRKNLKTVGNLP